MLFSGFQVDSANVETKSEIRGGELFCIPMVLSFRVRNLGQLHPLDTVCNAIRAVSASTSRVLAATPCPCHFRDFL